LLLAVFGVSAQVQAGLTLAWNPSSDSAVAGYHLHWGGASRTYTNSVDVGNVTSNAVSGLTAGATNFFAVTAYDTNGLESDFSNEIMAVVSLPAPWQGVDIGSVGAAGSASATAGAYTVQGAGAISSTADSFHFVYQPLSAGGEIRACLASAETATNGCAGVMIRESLTSGSRYALMGLSGNGAYRWQNRNNTGGNTSTATSGTGTPPGAWVRLVRTGNTLYGYKSASGTNWTKVSSHNITMATNIYMGFAVASGNSNTLNTATFNNVTVVP